MSPAPPWARAPGDGHVLDIIAGIGYIPEMDDLVTLKEAAARLGLSPSTLRHQARAGRVRARLIGKTWVTTADEVERYRRANQGRPGRTAPINPMLVRAFVAFDPVAGRSPAWLITYEQETFVIDPGGGNQVPFNWAGQPATEPIPSRERGDPLKPGFDVLTREQVEAALQLDLDVARRVYVGFPDPAVIFRAGPVWNAQTFALWRAVVQMRPPTEWSRPTP